MSSLIKLLLLQGCAINYAMYKHSIADVSSIDELHTAIVKKTAGIALTMTHEQGDVVRERFLRKMIPNVG